MCDCYGGGGGYKLKQSKGDCLIHFQTLTLSQYCWTYVIPGMAWGEEEPAKSLTQGAGVTEVRTLNISSLFLLFFSP